MVTCHRSHVDTAKIQAPSGGDMVTGRRKYYHAPTTRISCGGGVNHADCVGCPTANSKHRNVRKTTSETAPSSSSLIATRASTLPASFLGCFPMGVTTPRLVPFPGLSPRALLKVPLTQEVKPHVDPSLPVNLLSQRDEIAENYIQNNFQPRLLPPASSLHRGVCHPYGVVLGPSQDDTDLGP